MDLSELMERKLRHALAPQRLRLVDESHRHAVPAGAQSHWNVVIVSAAFAGLSPVERHRTVYAALGDELRHRVHALTLKTLTPNEWRAAGGELTNPAPPCRGG